MFLIVLFMPLVRLPSVVLKCLRTLWALMYDIAFMTLFKVMAEQLHCEDGSLKLTSSVACTRQGTFRYRATLGGGVVLLGACIFAMATFVRTAVVNKSGQPHPRYLPRSTALRILGETGMALVTTFPGMPWLRCLGVSISLVLLMIQNAFYQPVLGTGCRLNSLRAMGYALGLLACCSTAVTLAIDDASNVVPFIILIALASPVAYGTYRINNMRAKKFDTANILGEFGPNGKLPPTASADALVVSYASESREREFISKALRAALEPTGAVAADDPEAQLVGEPDRKEAWTSSDIQVALSKISKIAESSTGCRHLEKNGTCKEIVDAMTRANIEDVLNAMFPILLNTERPVYTRDLFRHHNTLDKLVAILGEIDNDASKADGSSSSSSSHWNRSADAFGTEFWQKVDFALTSLKNGAREQIALIVGRDSPHSCGEEMEDHYHRFLSDDEKTVVIILSDQMLVEKAVDWKICCVRSSSDVDALRVADLHADMKKVSPFAKLVVVCLKPDRPGPPLPNVKDKTFLSTDHRLITAFTNKLTQELRSEIHVLEFDFEETKQFCSCLTTHLQHFGQHDTAVATLHGNESQHEGLHRYIQVRPLFDSATSIARRASTLAARVMSTRTSNLSTSLGVVSQTA